MFRELFVIYLWAIVIPTKQWPVDDNGCRTPDNSVGDCIPIGDCDSILKYLYSISPPTEVINRTVESYYCGAIERSPKVCCPRDGNVEDVTTEDEDYMATPIPLSIDQNLLADKQCTAPSLVNGTCIPVKQCQPIIDFIRKSSPLTPDDVSVLQSYQCRDSEKVCCPDDNTFIIPSSKHTDVKVPPDISKHKNLRLLPEDCGPLTQDRIVNGNKTLPLEYPWMVLLTYKITYKAGSNQFHTSFLCGGTIINEWYILTAAHCVFDLPRRKLTSVRVGEHDIDRDPDCLENINYCAPPVQDIAVAEAIPHPNYKFKTSENDIGLLRLAERITFSESVKPVCLPTTKEQRSINLQNIGIIVTGWGVTETGEPSPDLLQVAVTVVAEEECRKAYENRSPVAVTHKQICAQGVDRGDSCGGDSGGPLQVIHFHNGDARFVELGVVSYGPQICGQFGRPGIYTRVDYYMEWILDNLKSPY